MATPPRKNDFPGLTAAANDNAATADADSRIGSRGPRGMPPRVRIVGLPDRLVVTPAELDIFEDTFGDILASLLADNDNEEPGP